MSGSVGRAENGTRGGATGFLPRSVHEGGTARSLAPSPNNGLRLLFVLGASNWYGLMTQNVLLENIILKLKQFLVSCIYLKVKARFHHGGDHRHGRDGGWAVVERGWKRQGESGLYCTQLPL